MKMNIDKSKSEQAGKYDIESLKKINGSYDIEHHIT